MRQHTAQDALARNLRRLRVARRWSLSELAAATGIGKATVSAIENGRANPTIDTVATLATALDAEVSELLAGAPDDDVTVVRAADADERLPRLAGGGVELGRGDLLSFPADRPHVFTTARRAAEAVVLVERAP